MSKTNVNNTPPLYSENGFYLGGTLSILYTLVIIYTAYEFSGIRKYKDSTSNKYSIFGIVAGILYVVGANAYYFSKRNKGDEYEQAKVRSNYAHITMIPIYLILLLIGFLLISPLFSLFSRNSYSTWK
jgi:hypothetical protein